MGKYKAKKKVKQHINCIIWTALWYGATSFGGSLPYGWSADRTTWRALLQVVLPMFLPSRSTWRVMSRSCRFNVHCPCSCLFQLIQTGIEASVQKAKDSCLTPACFQPRFSSVPRPPAFGQRALSTGRRGAASQTLVLFLGYLFCDPPSWCFNIFLAINYDLLFWSSDVRPNCQEPFPLAGEESSPGRGRGGNTR